MTGTFFDHLDDEWDAAFRAAFGAAHEAHLASHLRDERRRTPVALERLARAYGAYAWSSQLSRADSAERGGSRSGGGR